MGGKSSQSMTIGISTDTGTPVYTQINCTIKIGMEDVETEELDASCLSSTEKEFVLALPDAGYLSLDFNADFADAGYKILRAGKLSGALHAFLITFPLETGMSTARTMAFNGLVKSIPWEGAYGALITGSASIKVSGAVTETEPTV